MGRREEAETIIPANRKAGNPQKRFSTFPHVDMWKTFDEQSDEKAKIRRAPRAYASERRYSFRSGANMQSGTRLPAW